MNFFLKKDSGPLPLKSNQGQRPHKGRLDLCSLTKLLDPQMVITRDTTFTEIGARCPSIFDDTGLNSYSFSVLLF